MTIDEFIAEERRRYEIECGRLATLCPPFDDQPLRQWLRAESQALQSHDPRLRSAQADDMAIQRARREQAQLQQRIDQQPISLRVAGAAAPRTQSTAGRGSPIPSPQSLLLPRLERSIEVAQLHPGVAGAVAVSEGRAVLPPGVTEIPEAATVVALSGFFARGVFHGLRQSGADPANSEQFAAELDRLHHQPRRLESEEFIAGVVWSNTVDPIIAAVRLLNISARDLGEIASMMATIFATLLNDSNKVIAFKFGQYIGRSQSQAIIEAFTSQPPGLLAHTSFNWRSFELGRLVGPYIMAVVDLVLGVAEIPEMLMGAASLIRSVFRTVLDDLPGDLSAARRALRLFRPAEAEPRGLVRSHVDPPSPSATTLGAPTSELHARGTGGSVTSAGEPRLRGTATAMTESAPSTPARPRAERGRVTEHPGRSAIELASQPPATVNGLPLSPRLRRAWRRLAEEYGIDVTDEYTLRKLNEFYMLYEGQYVQSDNPVRLLDGRRAAGEFRTMIRYSRRGREGGSSVRRVRFLEPQHGGHTPDLAVVRVGRNGAEVVEEYVEVTTLTQANQTMELAEARGRHRQPVGVTEIAIRNKIFLEQISGTRPGTLVFHAPFQRITNVAREGWEELFARIRQSEEFPAGLRRIEVSTGEGGLIRFEGPNWRGRVIRIDGGID